MKNFAEIKSDVAVLCQRSGDTDYLTKIGVWIQLSHKLLSEVYDYYFELQDKYNFTTVSGQEEYPLPNNFDKPFRLYDLTNKIKLLPNTEEEYFDNNIANIVNSTTGTPDKFRIYGITGSRVQISSAGKTVQVKSSSTSDTSGIVVRIEGYIDSSLLILGYENITISTSTPTTYVAGSVTFYKIVHISKSANTTGYVTIADSGGTVLETLSPNERIARHKVLKLGLIPNAANSMRLLYKKTIIELVNDYDYPFIESDRYLILDAYGWTLKQDNKDQQAEFVWGHAKQALQAILLNQNSKLGSDFQHKAVNIWLQAHRNV